jgi:hypothetical protein
MWRVRLALVAVAVVVSAQLTVAIAVPDLSYIAGVYDGGDLDALVVLVSDQVPVIVKQGGVVWRDPARVNTLEPEVVPLLVASASGPFRPRAPPGA